MAQRGAWAVPGLVPGQHLDDRWRQSPPLPPGSRPDGLPKPLSGLRLRGLSGQRPSCSEARPYLSRAGCAKVETAGGRRLRGSGQDLLGTVRWRCSEITGRMPCICMRLAWGTDRCGLKC